MLQGAHICSYASDRYKILFDRITGLDPAKELFEGALHPVRIDIRDAKFVDVIHTDADGWGMKQETGYNTLSMKFIKIGISENLNF